MWVESALATRTATWADTCDANEQARDFEPSVGAMYGAFGIVLTIIGVLVLANANQVAIAIIIGAALVAGGAYAIIAGAVARGIQLGRR